MELPELVKSSKQFWQDVRERVLSTFLQGALAVSLAAPPLTNWSSVRSLAAAALIGGVAAVFSLAKALVVRNQGIRNSASSSKRV